MTTAIHSGFGPGKVTEDRYQANKRADRLEIAKDICLAALIGVAMFGTTIGFIVAAVKF